MSATSMNPAGARTMPRARPTGLDRAIIVVGLAMIRAARRHAERRPITSYEMARRAAERDRQLAERAHHALLGRSIL